MNAQIESQYLPSERLKRNSLIFMLIAIAFGLISASIRFNPLVIFTEFHHLVALVRDMTPPNFGFIARKPQIFLSLYSTISMALLGTILGGFIALCLSFLAARNLTPHPLLGSFIKLIFFIERVIPSFIILLFLFIAVGIGTFASMLTLAITMIGTFGKLFTESIEEVSPAILESLQATGLSRSQQIRFGILPEASPSIISNLLYAFDVNIRTAIGLGIFGGGGLGFELEKAMGLMEYRSALALMIIITILVFSVEKLSSYLRNRLVDTKLT